MARYKTWSLEQTLYQMRPEYQNGEWGIGIYSTAHGEPLDLFHPEEFEPEGYHVFCPISELGDVFRAVYTLHPDCNTVANVWGLFTTLYSKPIPPLLEKAKEMTRKMNDRLRRHDPLDNWANKVWNDRYEEGGDIYAPECLLD